MGIKKIKTNLCVETTNCEKSIEVFLKGVNYESSTLLSALQNKWANKKYQISLRQEFYNKFHV